MFAKTIIDSDAFLDMPVATQCLYFHLGMRADDDGVIANPKSIMRMCGAREDDMNLLIAKKFILVINNQIIVIKHWKINNYIQKDRYKQSNYHELISQLSLDENNAYTMNEKSDVYIMDTQVSIGKDSIDNICITNINITNTSELVSLTPNENALISLILNNKKYFNIFQKDIDYYQDLYPAVNVLQELKLMKGWLDSNPSNRKTEKGIKSFITRWLAKKQDKAPRVQNNNTSRNGFEGVTMLGEENGFEGFETLDDYVGFRTL
jgi:hypothetical protein